MKDLKCFAKIAIVPYLLTILSISACKDFIDVPLPGTETFTEDIYRNDIAANSAIVAIYAEMIGNVNKGMASGNTRSISYLCSLSADELECHSHLNFLREFYVSQISANNIANEKGIWTEAYKYIYAANAVLEGLKLSSGVSAELKNRLEGEALFIRAFAYFYLVNLYGDVPLALTTDHLVNGKLKRVPAGTVYDQIQSDLVKAVGKLPESYVDIEKTRPNKWVAVAFLSRVNLFMSKWNAADSLASLVIAQTNYGLDTLSGVFLRNSREAIWQLRPNAAGLNTWDGNILKLSALPGSGEANSTTITESLLNSFEQGDQRRRNWVDSIQISNKNYYFPSKYKIGNSTELKEYTMVLRLAEIYLIRAEARVHLTDISGASEDLNVVRNRAGLPSSIGNNAVEILKEIAQERRSELFTEWGHRWLDLKRTKTATPVLQNIKGSGWQSADILYPIPLSEIYINSNLVQNEGY